MKQIKVLKRVHCPEKTIQHVKHTHTSCAKGALRVDKTIQHVKHTHTYCAKGALRADKTIQHVTCGQRRLDKWRVGLRWIWLALSIFHTFQRVRMQAHGK